jgi:hypothetical protein
MKRILLTTMVLTGLAAGAGWAVAQTSATGHDHGAPAKTAAAKDAPGPAGASGKTDKGGMGMGHGESGMCGMMNAGGMAPMGGGMAAMMNMGGAGTQVVVKNIDKGVTITLTATDAAKVVRLQKMAEGMRLMHEATAQ